MTDTVDRTGLATYTFDPTTAKEWTRKPRGIVAETVLVAVLMTEMDLLTIFDTYSFEPITTKACGFDPTGILPF